MNSRSGDLIKRIRSKTKLSHISISKHEYSFSRLCDLFQDSVHNQPKSK